MINPARDEHFERGAGGVCVYQDEKKEKETNTVKTRDNNFSKPYLNSIRFECVRYDIAKIPLAAGVFNDCVEISDYFNCFYTRDVGSAEFEF